MGRHAKRKPCPFCAWPYTDMTDARPSPGAMHRVKCCSIYCGALGPACDSKEEAAERWDAALRPPEPVPLDFQR